MLRQLVRQRPVVLILEDYSPAADIVKAFRDAGLATQMLAHVPGRPWPTLAHMERKGTRLVVFAVTRYASVATIVTAIALAVLVVAFDYPWPIVVFGLAGAVAVIAMHHQNIRRLFAGTEHRFELGARAK